MFRIYNNCYGSSLWDGLDKPDKMGEIMTSETMSCGLVHAYFVYTVFN